MKLTPDQVYHISVAFIVHALFIITAGISMRMPNFITHEPESKIEVINIGMEKELPPVLPDSSLNDIINDSKVDMPIESPPIDNEEHTQSIPVPQSDLTAPEEESELPPKDLTKNGQNQGDNYQAPKPHGNIPKGGFSKGLVGPDSKEPQFFGEPIHGKCLFVMDNSGSMLEKLINGVKRIDNLRAEVLGAIKGFTNTDEFDCIIFYNKQVVSLWGKLKSATEENKQEAITWINKYTADSFGDTPTLDALKIGCSIYPKDLDNFLFISDGVPSSNTDVSQIIFDFPYLWNFDKGCKFLAICISDDGLAFMQKLAKLAKGKCLIVE